MKEGRRTLTLTLRKEILHRLDRHARKENRSRANYATALLLEALSHAYEKKPLAETKAEQAKNLKEAERAERKERRQ